MHPSPEPEYDAAKDAHDSYYVAIDELRRRKEWTDRLTAAKRVAFIGDCVMLEGDCLGCIPFGHVEQNVIQ